MARLLTMQGRSAFESGCYRRGVAACIRSPRNGAPHRVDSEDEKGTDRFAAGHAANVA